MRALLWDRVWAKVRWPDNLSDCYEWTGALSLKRRGQKRPVIKDQGKVKSVIRMVCEWYHGPPPSPFHEAGHTCPTGENCRCINPQHLQWMTRMENERYKRQSECQRVA